MLTLQLLQLLIDWRLLLLMHSDLRRWAAAVVDHMEKVLYRCDMRSIPGADQDQLVETVVGQANWRSRRFQHDGDRRTTTRRCSGVVVRRRRFVV